MKKLTKNELRQIHNAKAWDELDEMYNLKSLGTPELQVNKLVLAANDVFTSICEYADRIKIDIYEELKEDLPCFEGTDKCVLSSSTWKNFVNLAAQTEKVGTLNENVKLKLFQTETESGYNAALKKNFIDSYINGEEMRFPEQEEIVHQPNDIKNFSSPNFDKNLTDAIQIRNKLNDELWPFFRKHAMAAEHLTKIEYKDFKDLVDWEHYKRGGYPSENSKPRFYSLIERADRAIRLLQHYGFEQGTSIPNSFGWNLDIKEPHVAHQCHSKNADKWKKLNIIIPFTPAMRSRMGILDTDMIIELPDDNLVIVDMETHDIRSVVKKQHLIDRLPQIVISRNEDPYFKNAAPSDIKGFNFNNDKLKISPMTLQFLPEFIELGLGDFIDRKLNTLYRPLTQEELNIIGVYPYYFYQTFKKSTI